MRKVLKFIYPTKFHAALDVVAAVAGLFITLAIIRRKK